MQQKPFFWMRHFEIDFLLKSSSADFRAKNVIYIQRGDVIGARFCLFHHRPWVTRLGQ